MVLIEGAKLNVCSICARGGKILRHPEQPKPKPGSISVSANKGEKEIEIVEDYGRRIREARKVKGMTLEDLAKKIMEKENYLERVENEKTLPTETIAQKLERALSIRLFEDGSTGSVSVSGSKKAGGMTLGDMVSVKKKGQGK